LRDLKEDAGYEFVMVATRKNSVCYDRSKSISKLQMDIELKQIRVLI
jgi:hypothetical protein